jgi:hypothetical protein
MFGKLYFYQVLFTLFFVDAPQAVNNQFHETASHQTHPSLPRLRLTLVDFYI